MICWKLSGKVNNFLHLIVFSTIAKKCQSYERLSVEDKQKIKSILYIMDKFSVSQEAYHELTQQDPTLPRSYLLKGCQQFLDDEWKVTRTPGEFPGAELPFKELLEIELRKQVYMISFY